MASGINLDSKLIKIAQRSIRKRMLLSLLISMLIILGGLGAVSTWVTQEETEEVFSARLATSARVLEALLARQLEKATLASPIVIQLPDEIKVAKEDAPLSSGHPYENKIAFQIWSSDGMMLARSSSAPEEQLGPLTPGFYETSRAQSTWKVFVLPSGSIWVLAAEKAEVQQEMIEEITFSIITPLVIGGLVLLIVVNAIALRAVRPVDTLAANISNREPGSLSPIVLPDAPVELTPVIRELNALLVRIEDAFSREQRLIDSAAHELRTPIAAIHLHLQNAANTDDPTQRQICLDTALEASRRAAKLAEQLLVYSRISASAGMEEKTMLHLRAVCQDVIKVVRPIFDAHEQVVELVCTDDPVVIAEQSKLERLIRNLLENAAQYGVRPGRVGVALGVLNGHAQLSVENDGTAIPDGEKKRIFIPYYRIVGSSSFGSGLGLSIVQEIVNQSSGTIRVEDKSPGQGARFVVTLPLATPTD